MTENGDFRSSSPQPPEGAHREERVGEILRKARESRQLSIATIARNLKLNPRYIEALESSDYDLIPADAYIRVYLQSLSRHLSLNSEELLSRFFKERGVTGVDTLKRDPNTKINLALEEKKKPNPVFFGVAAVALALAIFAYMFWFAPFSKETAKPNGAAPAAGVSATTSAAPQTTPAPSDSATLAARAPDDILSGVLEGVSAPRPVLTHKDSVRAARNEKRRLASAKESLKPVVAEVKHPPKILDTAKKVAAVKSSLLKDSALKAKTAEAKSASAIAKETPKQTIIEPKHAQPTKDTGKPGTVKPTATAVAPKDTLKPVIADLKPPAKPNDTVKPVAAAPVATPTKDTAASKTVQTIAKPPATQPKDTAKQPPAKPAIAKDSLPKVKTSEVKAVAAPLKDSVLKAAPVSPVPAKDTVKNSHPVHDSAKKTSMATPPAGGKPMMLEIKATASSSWARVLSDGKPSRNLLGPGTAKSFSAQDSFQIRVGDGEAVSISLDGKPITLPRKGAVSLKIDRSGVSELSYEKWSTETNGRF
jgi:cytoskeletal protein RodZ